MLMIDCLRCLGCWDGCYYSRELLFVLERKQTTELLENHANSYSLTLKRCTPFSLLGLCFQSLHSQEHYITSRYYRPQHIQPAAQYGKVSSFNRPCYDMHRIDAVQFSSLFRAQTPWGHLALPLFRLLDADGDNLVNVRVSKTSSFIPCIPYFN